MYIKKNKKNIQSYKKNLIIRKIKIILMKKNFMKNNQESIH